MQGHRIPSRHHRRGWVAGCALLALALGACAGPYGYPGPKSQLGMLTGAAAGGLVGSAASHGEGGAILAGVLLGGLVGGAIGDSMDRADRRYAAHSFYRGLEHNAPGRPSHWQNPRNGHHGSVTPRRSYETHDGVCREYTQTVVIDGHTRRAYGTACRDAHGRWRVTG